MPSSLHRGVILVSAICAGIVSGEPAANSAVTGIRFWSFGDTTRVVIETTGEFELRSDRVPNPDRLFFDLTGARMRLGRRGQHTIPVNDPLLKQIRVAETAPGVTRVVFDLEAGVEHVASQLTNPERVIVELRPTATHPAPPPNSPTLVSSVRSSAETGSMAVKTSSVPRAALPVTNEPPAEPRMTETPAPEITKKAPQPGKLPEPTVLKQKADAVLKAPRPAKLEGSNSLTRVLGLKVGRIVIDPGHGGHDTGTSGPGGLLEKDVVLDVAKRLGALIESRMGAEVVFTRDDDTFIPLETRTHMANERKADLFLSIHANSSPARNSSGVETYYLNFTSSQAALEVAARENASSQKTVYELRDLLQKIALQDKVDESKEFAAKVQEALYSASSRANSRTRDRGVKKAPFVVLIGAAMPSVLAEVGFVSNPRDEALFKKAAFRQRIAEGLYKGLSQYAATLSEFHVASK